LEASVIAKTIDTLIEDIEKVLVDGIDANSDNESVLNRFASELASVLIRRLIREKREPTLRFSNIGQPCDRKLWYEINESEEAEPLRAETYLKFLYGDIIEELMLFLAELAGHEVKGRQDEQEIEGIKGHRDAVIDGTLVDVKSASSYSFKKFKEGKLSEDDPFGYIPQILSYLEASREGDDISEKDRAAFLVVDKTLGHITLDFHERRPEHNWPELFNKKKETVAQAEPPERAFSPEQFGKSGNMKLGTNCSYCPFMKRCWPEVRTFLYSYGPVHLVEVKNEPAVTEITN
jgi:hypothetical protein